MPMDIIEDKGLWDRFIEASPFSSIFLKWDFLKIIEKHSKSKLLPYGIYKGDELICVLPLFYDNMYGIRLIFSPPPRTGVRNLGFVMAPVYNQLKQRRKESYNNLIADEIAGEFKKLLPHYVSISTVQQFIDLRPFYWNDYDLEVDFTYVIDIDKPIEQIWKGFGKDCRKGIQSVGRSDIVLEQVSDVGSFYRFMEQRYQEQAMNFPLLASDYLTDVLKAFPNNVRMYFLKKGDEIIDMEVSCAYKDRYKLWLGGAIMQKGSHGSQEYSTYELIKKAKEEGHRSFEIMGANVRRLCMFQSKFNPGLEFYFTVYKRNLVGTAAEWAYLNVMKKRF